MSDRQRLKPPAGADHILRDNKEREGCCSWENGDQNNCGSNIKLDEKTIFWRREQCESESTNVNQPENDLTKFQQYEVCTVREHASLKATLLLRPKWFDQIDCHP